MRWLATALCVPLAATAAFFGPTIQSTATSESGGLSLEWGVPTAEASVSILMSVEELVAGADSVVVGTVLERKTRWEEVAGSRRIVTLTRVAVEERVVGSAPSDVWVRSLGGVVDDIGQAVAGEPRFTIGDRALLFLGEIDGVNVTIGRAQGHYVVVDDEDDFVLKPSPEAGTLLPRPGPAVSARERLVDAELDAARKVILEAKKRVDARETE